MAAKFHIGDRVTVCRIITRGALWRHCLRRYIGRTGTVTGHERGHREAESTGYRWMYELDHEQYFYARELRAKKAARKEKP